MVGSKELIFFVRGPIGFRVRAAVERGGEHFVCDAHACSEGLPHGWGKGPCQSVRLVGGV